MSNRRASLLALTAAVVACTFRPSPLTPPEPPPIPEVATRASLTTVGILDRIHADEWERIVCGGVWVGPHRILTVAHCAAASTRTVEEHRATVERLVPPPPIEGRQLRYVLYSDWLDSSGGPAQSAATVSKVHEEADLALLFTEDSSEVWAAFRFDPLETGDSVFSVGHQGGAAWTYTSGEISYPRRSEIGFGGLLAIVQVSIAVGPGSSGGGVWDDFGRLVTVGSRVIAPAANQFLGPHPEEVRAFLFD